MYIADSSSSTNLILNHDFTSGMNSWHPNCFYASIVTAKSGLSHAVVTKRKETLQGLEQDITTKLKPYCLYRVSATVSVSGPVTRLEEVIATLKLKSQHSPTKYQFIAKTCVFKEKWVNLEGMFLFKNLPEKVVFYLEGPSPGVDLLIQSVTIHCEREFEDTNIIMNPNFEIGLNKWSGRSCEVKLHESMAKGKIVAESGKAFASAIKRTANWNGIEQEITGKVKRKQVYEVTAFVRIYGNNVKSATVKATLWYQNPSKHDEYIGISKVQARDEEWMRLKGKFVLNDSATRIIIYLEGPPPGIDILVDNLTVVEDQA